MRKELERFHALNVNQKCERIAQIERIEQLVGKDEADRAFDAQLRRDLSIAITTHCTCGTTIPCAILGHS